MRYTRTRLPWIVCAVLIVAAPCASANSAPEVTNVVVQQRPGTQQVDICYDLYDADGDLMVVTATCLNDGGNPVSVSSTQYGSDIGAGIVSGQGKHIVWDAGIDMPGHAGDDYVVRVTACDSWEPDMVQVPNGTFTQGDGVAACGVDQRWVMLTRDFYLGRYEVMNQEYMEAVQWARDHGYATATTTTVQDNLDDSTAELLDLNGSGCEIAYSEGVFSCSNPTHPVNRVTWYGAARYCDWLSMQAGLPRAYQHSGDWACNSGNPYGAEGYRLPTDAEWEYAAQYDDEWIYPWGNEAPSCARANYLYCVYWTSPRGSCSPAGDSHLGCSDLPGNLWEWCNDWFLCNLGSQTISNPVGETTGNMRVVRGGSWNYNDYGLRCAVRHGGYPDYSNCTNVGFRVARTATR